MNSEIVELYKETVEKRRSWPRNFFRIFAKERILAEITDYLFNINDVKTYEDAELLLTDDFAQANRLNELVKKTYRPPEMLPNEYIFLAWYAFPEARPAQDELTIKVFQDILSGKRKSFPTNYFVHGADVEHKAVVCFRYLCTDVLKLDEKGIIETFGNSYGIQVLLKYRLKIVLDVLYDSLPHLLMTAYPNLYLY